MCLQQTDLGEDKGKGKGKAFVVSLFGVRDDIKAHHSKEKARICDARWKTFLRFCGATVEDIWGGVKEADRKLWSVSYGSVSRGPWPSVHRAGSGRFVRSGKERELSDFSRIGWDGNVDWICRCRKQRVSTTKTKQNRRVKKSLQNYIKYVSAFAHPNTTLHTILLI